LNQIYDNYFDLMQLFLNKWSTYCDIVAISSLVDFSSMVITRRLFLASSAAMTAVIADQLGRSQPVSAKDKVVNLYTARHYAADNQVYEGFFKQTGIKVNLVEAPADQLIERVKSEGANSPADVIMTVDAGNLVRAKNEEILQQLNDAELNGAIDRNYRDPSGFWYGFTKRGRVVMYNKDLVKDPSMVKTYADLADAKIKADGRKGILVRSSSNIYNQSLVGAILDMLGEEKTEAWVKGLVENFARKPEGNDTAQLKALAAGQGEFAISNTYYLARLAKSSKQEDRDIAAKIGVIFPTLDNERGTHFNISGGGLAKHAPNRDHAVQFLKYLISPDAQKIFAGSNNEYPMAKGVEVDSVLSSYGSFKEDTKTTAATFARNNSKALQIMNKGEWK
jgi:iron(III) transport system substrate-binding protein